MVGVVLIDMRVWGSNLSMMVPMVLQSGQIPTEQPASRQVGRSGLIARPSTKFFIPISLPIVSASRQQRARNPADPEGIRIMT